MAQALASRLLGATQVESAGIDADEGASATKDAVRVMQERGLDISAHHARPFELVDLRQFDLVVALTPAIEQALRGQGADASKLRSLDILDPYCKGIETYRSTADAIDRELRLFFEIPVAERRNE
jgi:protein-tyrosine-phosphatase